MSTTFFTSDPHLFHRSVGVHRGDLVRPPEGAPAEVHEEHLGHCLQYLRKYHAEFVSAWNYVVTDKDDGYILGDFAYDMSRNLLAKLYPDTKVWHEYRTAIRDLLDAMRGRKHLIIGNHDPKKVINCPAWSSVQYYKELKLPIGEKHVQRIVLSHYSMRTWNRQHHGSWMLYGHSHGNLPDIGGLTMDVGVDTRGSYVPYSLDEIQEIMSERKVVNPGDHHTTKS